MTINQGRGKNKTGGESVNTKRGETRGNCNLLENRTVGEEIEKGEGVAAEGKAVMVEIGSNSIAHLASLGGGRRSQ